MFNAPMAITRSAKKAMRASERKHVFNVRRKKALHDSTKSISKALSKGDAAAAEKLLPAAYQAIDKAAKRGVIKPNTAARKKASLVRALRRSTQKTV